MKKKKKNEEKKEVGDSEMIEALTELFRSGQRSLNVK